MSADEDSNATTEQPTAPTPDMESTTTSDGQLIVYDVEKHTAWICADETIQLSEAR